MTDAGTGAVFFICVAAVIIAAMYFNYKDKE